MIKSALLSMVIMMAIYLVLVLLISSVAVDVANILGDIQVIQGEVEFIR